MNTYTSTLIFFLLFTLNNLCAQEDCGCQKEAIVIKYKNKATSGVDVQCTSQCATLALYTCYSNCVGFPKGIEAKKRATMIREIVDKIGCDCNVPASLGSNLSYNKSSNNTSKNNTSTKPLKNNSSTVIDNREELPKYKGNFLTPREINKTKLKVLQKLKDLDLITEEEFKNKKKELLNQ
ncbi:hypothetical protein [Aureispira anguillae]|uniref:SHOCT domain-containing protein n=1 Tax=Aureispira anguillae TaxID=2864201 RepID=A0A915YCH1_9BACT|nr:hypothetical protein [Aureispira anguillae]BDS10548.1 hypothetical protein AsAng_0012560 [Aureispira anguillae]